MVVDDKTAIPVRVISRWNNNVRENSKAIQFLVSGRYLKLHQRDNNQYLTLEPLGLDAFHGEFFLNQYHEERRKRSYNIWAICLNVIIAIGVIYSIYKDEFKGTPSAGSIQNILISPESKVDSSRKTQPSRYRPTPSTDTAPNPKIK